MALMVLTKLPTEEDLDAAGVAPNAFLNAFNKHAVSPFIAEVKSIGNYVMLDEYGIRKADWFQCFEV